MAYLLQGLIVFAAWGADFSHPLHLKLKPDCLSCHTGAAASTKLEDNLLPAAEACAGCHKEVSIKRPRAVRLVKFDHAFHVRMGNIAPLLLAAVKGGTYLEDPLPAALRPKLEAAQSACTSCHRGLAESTATGPEHFPHMADCLVCHNKIDPPFSCETCHGADKALKPATHTNDFLDTHNRKGSIAKTGCSNCHGRKFTCLGCH